MRVLCFDAGSSSLKYGVIDSAASQAEPLCEGSLGADAPVDAIFELVRSRQIAPEAIGHRIVFGGLHADPEPVTNGLLAELDTYCPIDPLHLPAQLRIVRSAAALAHGIPQVLCFDTAFHRGMPDIARHLPLPPDLDPLIVRYGYHGLSYEYIVSTVDFDRYHRVLIAHLGSGASMAAVRDGKPVDSSMGFTPLGGLMMASRTGDLDPGVLLYLLREKHFSASDLDRLLTQRSGLRGVSGTSGDMRELLARAPGDPRAQLAVQLFIYVAIKHAGALAAVLGGLDLLVFTGGIGENAAPVRDGISAGLRAFGEFEVRVTPTRETLTIARQTAGLLGQSGVVRSTSLSP